MVGGGGGGGALVCVVRVGTADDDDDDDDDDGDDDDHHHHDHDQIDGGGWKTSIKRKNKPQKTTATTDHEKLTKRLFTMQARVLGKQRDTRTMSAYKANEAPSYTTTVQ